MRDSCEPDPGYLHYWEFRPAGPCVGSELLAEQVPGLRPLGILPSRERALADFERILDEYDRGTTLEELLEQVDRQLARLHPGGDWTKGEQEAVKLLRGLAARLRARFL